MEMNLDDEMLTLLLLSSLPDSWETFVLTLSNSAPNGKLTFSMVKDGMLNEEERHRDVGNDQSQALVTENRGSGIKVEGQARKNRDKKRSWNRRLWIRE
ncbi:hypothetical protein RJ640_019321 [Escallonia rubra]|uniref:Uncharacterized protein n=1 Tax=Escallonia rubra TaxID=112253 RepID=A0AA88RMR0_9ASTE|nr:hypothetical protein RJ640_019321 [Escallonia rubra]